MLPLRLSKIRAAGEVPAILPLDGHVFASRDEKRELLKGMSDILPLFRFGCTVENVSTGLHVGNGPGAEVIYNAISEPPNGGIRFCDCENL